MRFGAFVALSLCVGCGFRHGSEPAKDAAIDAAPDAYELPTSRKQMEVVSGGGRTRAGTITIDVEVGHAVPVVRSVAGTKTIEGAPVIKP